MPVTPPSFPFVDGSPKIGCGAEEVRFRSAGSGRLLASISFEWLFFAGELPLLIVVFSVGDPTGVKERPETELFLD